MHHCVAGLGTIRKNGMSSKADTFEIWTSRWAHGRPF
jgi:hypothetical protein